MMDFTAETPDTGKRRRREKRAPCGRRNSFELFSRRGEQALNLE